MAQKATSDRSQRTSSAERVHLLRGEPGMYYNLLEASGEAELWSKAQQKVEDGDPTQQMP